MGALLLSGATAAPSSHTLPVSLLSLSAISGKMTRQSTIETVWTMSRTLVAHVSKPSTSIATNCVSTQAPSLPLWALLL